MAQNNTRLGIILMVATVFVFAVQDAISRHLASEYNTMMIVMIRYWFFAAFVITIAARSAGGFKAAVQTSQLKLQIMRGLILAIEICVMVQAFVLLGLVESLAIFAANPLLIAALSGPILGESVGWRRWAAIGVGCVGILIILQPGIRVFSPVAIIPIISTTLYATYGLLTRLAARKDSTATSFFWTGIVGCVVMTAVGLQYWEPMSRPDWVWMSILCVTGVMGHWLLIKTYEVAEASAVQPFAYFHLVFASILGVSLFGEVIRPSLVVGAALVIGAGLFTLWRERQKAA